MPKITKVAVRLKEIWENLTRSDIQIYDVSFQKAKYGQSELLFLYDDYIYVAECNDGTLWVNINNSDPHRKVSAQDILTLVLDGREVPNSNCYGAYAKSWEDILNIASLFQGPMENWPKEVKPENEEI